MEQALEEVVAHVLDDLYVGALHLSGGDREAAEDMLVDTIAEAASRFRTERPEDVETLLEGLLVETFLARESRGAETAPASDRAPVLDVGAGPAEILGWMGTLPPRIRSTIWLVVVRRHPYRRVAETLRVDRSAVSAWVREGHERLFRAGARTSLSGDSGR